MPIYDQGYQRWTGEIPANPVRWWPITRRANMVKASGWELALILLGGHALPGGATLYVPAWT